MYLLLGHSIRLFCSNVNYKLYECSAPLRSFAQNDKTTFCSWLCYNQVVRVRPNDKDAKLKYQECNKIVKQKAFERAIASDELKRSVVDSLDIENMSK